MQVFQKTLKSPFDADDLVSGFQPNLFLLFVSPTFPHTREVVDELRAMYPNAVLMGCSTAGEIAGDRVLDDSISLTGIAFAKTRIKLECARLQDNDNDSEQVGKKISGALDAPDLKHLIVLSDGLQVNGADLVKGLKAGVSEHISITGGLAGDGPRFRKTFVIANGEIVSGVVVGLGLYGSDLKIGCGSKGGWDSFGIERLVTRSQDNVLYELDGQPALQLYKSFLGDKAKDLPGSGLLFPLSLRTHNDRPPVVRTILGIDEGNQSLTFAGNIPEGAYVRLMKANVDRIINGAEQSAQISKEAIKGNSQLAILISCVGRRLVMKQLVEEEVEAVNEVLGPQVMTTGFYSYGEIAPFDQFSPCELHNQTMTITTFEE